jgi:hypothetical protein
MLVAFRADRFQDNLFEDETNASRLTRFVPYVAEKRPGKQHPSNPPLPPLSPRSASKYVLLISTNLSVIEDFSCDDYFPFDVNTIKEICKSGYSCSRVLDYLGAFVMEKEYAYLYLEDLGGAGEEFSNWISSLMSTTRYATDNWMIAGRSEAESFHAAREFSAFCDQFHRLSIATTNEEKLSASPRLSYRDVAKKASSVVPSIDTSLVAGALSARNSARALEQWHPKVVVTKSKADHHHHKLNKKYGVQAEDSAPMLTDEGLIEHD